MKEEVLAYPIPQRLIFVFQEVGGLKNCPCHHGQIFAACCEGRDHRLDGIRQNKVLVAIAQTARGSVFMFLARSERAKNTS